MVLNDMKSQMEVERTILGKKKCTCTINRWIREYIQEGEENCFKKKRGLKKEVSLCINQLLLKLCLIPFIN